MQSASDYGACQYAYANDNKLMSITLPDNSVIYYDYDENGRILQIRYPGTGNKRLMNYQQNGWCVVVQDSSYPWQYRYMYNYNNDGTIPIGQRQWIQNHQIDSKAPNFDYLPVFTLDADASWWERAAHEHIPQL